MILNFKENVNGFLKILETDSFLAKKIKCEFLANENADTSSFYILNNCAFMLIGQNLTLCGEVTDADIQQILSFCQFLGVKAIESQFLNLPIDNIYRLQLMRYKGDSCAELEEVVANENIYGFSKFCCENFTDINFDTVYSNMARKINKGLGDIYYTLNQQHKVQSGLLCTKYGDDDCYLTFVCTDKLQRKNGLASSLIRHAIAKNKDKNVFLVCENVMENFYKKIGFCPVDTIILNTLKEDSI